MAASFRVYESMFVAWALFGSGQNLITPSLQTCVGQLTHPSVLGKVTSQIVGRSARWSVSHALDDPQETSWAFSALVGFPIMGVLIDNYGWHAPFIFLVGLLLPSGALLVLLFPRFSACECSST